MAVLIRNVYEITFPFACFRWVCNPAVYDLGYKPKPSKISKLFYARSLYKNSRI